MRSVADDLRRDTVARVLRLDVRARVALALTLGDEDLARFMAMTGLSRDVALQRLSARRNEGRAPSCAMRLTP